jgi:HicA toxin of bacterial toxin-antitoxin,
MPVTLAFIGSSILAVLRGRPKTCGRCRYLIVVPFKLMKRRHERTLDTIFAHTTSANVQWRDVEALFRELGAEISEREGSRVAVVLFSEVRVFHRPHPSPNTDKGAVASIRR